MLLICHDDAAFIPEETLNSETVAWVQEMERRGVRRAGW